MTARNDTPQDRITIKIMENVPGELAQAQAHEEKMEYFGYGALAGVAGGIVLAFALLCGMGSCVKPTGKPAAIQKK